jgi:hypothetical protein
MHYFFIDYKIFIKSADTQEKCIFAPMLTIFIEFQHVCDILKILQGKKM